MFRAVVRCNPFQGATTGSVRHLLWTCLFAALSAHCAKSGSSSSPDDAGGADSTVVPEGGIISLGDDSSSGQESGGVFVTGDGAGGFAGALTVTPANPVVVVTIQNGTIQTMPVAFTASSGGHPVDAAWSIDHGELGAISSVGVFQASGSAAGPGTITAQYGNSLATTTVTVQILAIRSGGPTAAADGGVGGFGGVGGEGPGGPADAGSFAGAATAPASPQEFGFLYPYDHTVWPRGLLAPLLQWQTTHTAQSVFIHLKQADYEFKGYYAFAAALTGVQRMRQPIDEQAWDQATHSNQGDPLHVEVTIAAADGVFGPIAEDWTIAPAILQGTVYYGSYNTALNQESGNAVTGAVLAIQPGGTSPTLAVPSLYGHCHVCHEVSANGSTLFTNDDIHDWGFGASYDLTKGAALDTRWDSTNGNVNGLGYNDLVGRLTYSGVYPDGTFALANSQDDFHSFGGSSDLFSRDTLLAIPSNGFTSIVDQAVTPAFSPDGRRVSFNFWQARSGADAGVDAGNGRSLDVMDFSCGADAGSVACASPPYAFSNLREIYRDANRYAGWPSFTPDGNTVIFQSTISPSTEGSPLNTYMSATAELMIADARVPSQFSPQRLCALNGFRSDCQTPYLPVVTNHPNDTIYNYEPTVNPVATGGYYWVVFTTRRAYGNVAQGDPYESNSYSPIDHPTTKKLWIAAIDEKATAGVDPSHPAFYLPGQELNAGNMRGYFVVAPCLPDGSACTTGDQCCNGFCRKPSDGGALACTPVVTGCSNEYERCVQTSDCCGAPQGYTCINGLCARPAAAK